MPTLSKAYASKIAVADALGMLRARAVTITAVARTRPVDSTAAYIRATGQSPHRGQKPKVARWALKTMEHRRHAAVLLLAYAQLRATFAERADAHGVAFVLAYQRYLAMVAAEPGGALVSIDRFNLLVGTGYSLGWRSISTGGTSKFADDNVKILRCTRCSLPHLVEAHRQRYKCDECIAAAKPSRSMPTSDSDPDEA